MRAALTDDRAGPEGSAPPRRAAPRHPSPRVLPADAATAPRSSPRAPGRPQAIADRRCDFRAGEINGGMCRYGRLLRIIFFIVSIEART